MNDPRSLLRAASLRANKKLGQHFLVDPNTLRIIVAAAELQPEDTVLEIGAGTGALTAMLAESSRHVMSVEIDERLRPLLEESLIAHRNVDLIFADFLQLDFTRQLPPGPYLVVANLPYYISNAILRRLLEASRRPFRMVLTVQKEVAERILAPVGQLSVLALSAQYYGQTRLVHRLNSTVFWPPPQVESAVIRLDESATPRLPRAAEIWLFQVIRAGFSQKRKQLRNSLANGLGLGKDAATRLLERAQIEPERRAETLQLSEWIQLAQIARQPP
ncbi:MAG: 16S rRNA (adenine(1518)-N(6)/adenine(1519)-N(6))-dimethyltransferase RsmA [Anaerolineaceae bacterium]|nr:16S rRNA (adenine(1518)-N(6)/adenine(1519)-N(6))-dimethyltransferase RsmA [Anaerolineaceae bacterium]